MLKSPTEKQITFAAEIAATLGLEFPVSSRDFTRSRYSNFISAHINDYDNVVNWIDEDTLDYLGLYENDAWCEHY